GRGLLRLSEQAEFFAAPREGQREGKGEERRALHLALPGRVRAIIERRGLVAPYPDGFGGLLFLLADIDMFALGALAPVDATCRIIGAILLELPEILARAGAAAAVHAHIEGVDKMLGRQNQRRKGLDKPFRIRPLILFLESFPAQSEHILLQ